MHVDYKKFIQLAKGNGPEVYFNALYLRLSHPVSFLLSRMGFSPNAVTYASILFALLGGLSIFFSQVILGCILLMLSYLFDFCDGNVARYIASSGGHRTAFDKERGKLLENINSNLGYLMMFGALGYYFAVTSSDIRLFLLAFAGFGVKMVMRYTNMQAAIVYKEFMPQSKTDETPLGLYNQSLKNKIKFLLSKCLFAANFYFVVYFFTFVFAPQFALQVFFVYTAADVVWSTVRLLKIASTKY